MSKAVVINGSPRMERGDTAMVLTPFIQDTKKAPAVTQSRSRGYHRRTQKKPGPQRLQSELSLLKK